MTDQPILLRTVDLHTAGEPVRIVVDGYPELRGATILQKRRDARDRLDHLRRALMLEPRGHAGMYGVIPTSACDPTADFAVLFTHQEGYSTMCGHATIALGRWAVESGRVPLDGDRAAFRLEAPCGVVEVEVRREDRSFHVTFESVPSFALHLDHALDVPGFGSVLLDVAFGGAFYAILPAARLGLSLMETSLTELVAAGAAITAAGRARIAIEHPDDADLAFLYGTILTDDVAIGDADDAISHNLCIFADGQIDRSPTGSGVTARIALAAARGAMQPGRSCVFRGVSGQSFVGTLSDLRTDQGRTIARVKVGGTAWPTGRHEFRCDRDDAFAFGFTLPDTFGNLPGGDLTQLG